MTHTILSGTSIQFIVAGNVATNVALAPLDSLEVVMKYLTANQNTIEQYDGIAGTVTAITRREIEAADVIMAQWGRNPISPHAAMTREGWFEGKNLNADWASVAGATFEAADPNIVGDLYDHLLDVWYSFADSDRFQKDILGNVLRNSRGRMSYAGFVQINKVLHLVKPNLFPIFDRVLSHGYSTVQDESDRAVLMRREGANPHHDHFSWEPFRSDLVANQTAGVFKSVRAGLLSHETQLTTTAGSPIALAGFKSVNAWVSANITDMRIMDMLAWWYFKHH
ncbi:MAG: hypothetical protein ACYC19_02175 [Acidimicrobiales bacterium]